MFTFQANNAVVARWHCIAATKTLEQRNTTAFSIADLNAIITIASGCGRQLQDYQAPCSLRNGMRAEQGALQLLQLIPDLNIIQLPKTIVCCGSAGSYSLEHSDMASALLDDILNAIPTEATYLVTSNIGCALPCILPLVLRNGV
jgi:glycolate oxidase iron-sulfur subunit